MSTERPYHFDHLLQVLKRSLWSLILYIFFNFSCMYIHVAPGQEQTTPWWQSFDVNRSPDHFDNLLQVSKWSLWILILYTFFFNILYMYIAPGQRQTNLWGQNFDVNRKLLPLRPFVASFKTIFGFWFYTHFVIFFHIYIAQGQGQTSLLRQNSDVSWKALSFCPFVASLKKYLWSLILYIFLPVYSPGEGAGTGKDNPLGSEFLF